MKKLTTLDDKMLSLLPDSELQADTSASSIPTLRGILRMIGNVRADNADDSRRTARIAKKLRDKSANELVLENDDMNFLLKQFEKNNMGLTAWMQGQILDIIESAEKAE